MNAEQSRWHYQASYDIAKSCDEVTELVGGPRFLFHEFIEEVQGIIRKHDPNPLDNAQCAYLYLKREILRTLGYMETILNTTTDMVKPVPAAVGTIQEVKIRIMADIERAEAILKGTV